MKKETTPNWPANFYPTWMPHGHTALQKLKVLTNFYNQHLEILLIKSETDVINIPGEVDLNIKQPKNK